MWRRFSELWQPLELRINVLWLEDTEPCLHDTE